MKVLLLEDVRSEREISARLLTAARHEVAVAADTKEAFEALRAHKVDVVVLDLGFAGGKGLEVLKSIRSQESTGHVYIIAQGENPSRPTFTVRSSQGPTTSSGSRSPEKSSCSAWKAPPES